MKKYEALAVIESISIAKGIEAADTMLKKAAVELIFSRVICPGKYLTIIVGSVSETKDALEAGLQVGGDSVVDSLFLSNPHESIFPALAQATAVKNIEALGIVETFSMCGAIEAADLAAKGANITLVDLRISIMLAGKSFITLTGKLSGVQSAMDGLLQVIRDKGSLVAAVIIPNPREELDEFLL